ncbi:HYDIN protein, partial [Dasyornis broadbenti]|nr:HYDIN protein [Dasyornis broadbenti]
PSELVFQHFVANESYELVLSLINNDEVPRTVKVSMESSPYFQLVCPRNVFYSVEPGTSSSVRIRFTPDEIKNYAHKLFCFYGRETVVVPLYGIVTRGLLDLPELLDFSVQPAKCSVKKTLLVCNIGNMEARYHMSTQSPFSVVPAKGTLGVGDTMQVTVEFYPTKTGFQSAILEVSYDTGERSQTRLHGEAVDLDVALSTTCAEVGKTFMTQSNHTTVAIQNRSSITARFQWKIHPTDEAEAQEKKRVWDLRRPKSGLWLTTFMEEQEKEKKGIFEDDFSKLCSKVKEEYKQLQEEPYLFSDDIFSIEPLEGEIKPNCSAEIKVIFKPKEGLNYHKVAYCYISGRAERMMLDLKGEGLGPWLELSNKDVEFAMLYVNTPHVAEINLINKGPLDAPFAYVPSETEMSPSFKVVPKEGIVPPGSTQPLQIFCDCTIVGILLEHIRISVTGCPSPLIVTVRGTVWPPTFSFSASELDFLEVSFGFPKTLPLRVTNKTPGYFKFKFRVTDDGGEPAISSYKLILNDADPAWEKGPSFKVEPQEFAMTPSEGIMYPFGYQDVQVTLCSNTVMEYCRRLVLDVEGFGEVVTSLIITASCHVPKLEVYPNIMWYEGTCYMNEPHKRKFLITNNTCYYGCYGLVPQKRNKNTRVFYESCQPCGVVRPHSTAKLPITIRTQKVGKFATTVTIAVFGNERYPLTSILRTTGLFREVCTDVYPLDFGAVPALNPTPVTMNLSNKGAAPLPFKLEVDARPHFFIFEPGEGVIPANRTIPVTTTAYLDDTGSFDTTLGVYVEHQGVVATIPVTILGVGTTIVLDKPFCGDLNLGYQF